MAIRLASVKEKLRSTWAVIRAAGIGYDKDNASLMGAGVAFWAVLSSSPMLVLLIVFTSLAYDTETTRAHMVQWLNENLGGRATEWTISMLESASAPGATTLPGIASLLLMVWSASRMFHALQMALNHIWHIRSKQNENFRTVVLHIVKKRALTFLLFLAILILIILSLAIGTAMPLAGRILSLLPGSWYVYQTIEFLASSVVICIGIGLVYMILPDARVSWRFVWRGALLTGVLMIFGKMVFGWYLGRQSLGSYGAAGSVVALLLWIYYTTQVFFFGAELTQSYARIIDWSLEPERGFPIRDDKAEENDESRQLPNVRENNRR